MNKNITSQTQKHALPRKIFAILFYILALISLVVLIKTELRKWFFFDSELSSANTVIFWSSLIFGFLFLYLGNKIWPNKITDTDNQK